MKKKFITLCIVIVLSVLAGISQYYNPSSMIDRVVMDHSYQHVQQFDSSIKIIKIDEKTLNAYGHFGSWSREVYGKLVNLLNEQGKPYLIGFDIMFTGTLDKQGDDHFVKACQDYGNVVVVNNVIFNQQLSVETVEEPFDDLKKVTKQGFSNPVIDKDGVIRKALLKTQDNRDSFSGMIAKAYASKQNIPYQEPQTDKNNVFGFNYTTKSDTYEEISLVDVIDEKIDLKVFKDSIVLIGAHAIGMQDAYDTAIEYGKQMYGVEIHANIIEALLYQRTLLPINSFLSSFMISVLTFVYMILMMRSSLFQGMLVFVISVAIYISLCLFMYKNGQEMPIVHFVSLMFGFYVLKIIRSYMNELKRRKGTINLFKRYLSPDIVEKLVNAKELNIALSGDDKDIAVMFVDIRGFTALSENLCAKEVVDVLNEFFNLTSQAIFKNHGTLDKYIGDATMAVFNSPLPLDDYEMKAVITGLEIIRGQKELSLLTLEKYGVEIGIGIGIHCGDAVIGNIGCERRLDFTAIGDCVNTAARIEGKALSGQLLISQEMKERLGKRIQTNSLGEVKLKGKSHSVKVYEVLDIVREE